MWKLCKDKFFLQLGNPCSSIQPFWTWQIKRYNATQASTEYERAGAYLQDVRSQFKHHFTVNLNEFLERWRKQEKKPDLSQISCKKDVHLLLAAARWSVWCRFFPLARLQSIPCAPGDQSEGEPAHSDVEKAKYSA